MLVNLVEDLGNLILREQDYILHAGRYFLLRIESFYASLTI